MPAPGEYLADVTEGIPRVEDLPKATILKRSRNYKRCPCPRCGRRAYRLRRVTRLLHDVGGVIKSASGTQAGFCSRAAQYWVHSPLARSVRRASISAAVSSCHHAPASFKRC